MSNRRTIVLRKTVLERLRELCRRERVNVDDAVERGAQILLEEDAESRRAVAR